MTEIILKETIESDMKQSYMDYAMSVIVGRAIPDMRDGLKPVHRRIIYSMYEMGLFHNKAYKKCARVVGDVLGKYHPHGDTAIYDSLVRMAQDFSLRYPLADGQGNFGNIDGDNAAAMRYTEIRLKPLAEMLLKDIDKETVEFTDNFDGSLKEPSVLPSQVPNLLINGSSGIAVGMATNIPPHNLIEIVDACTSFIDGADEEKLMQIVTGPDFPTGGIIVGKGGFYQAYKNGRGIIKVRGKAEVVGKEIKITEIPYQVTKKAIIDAIVNAVKEKKIDGISGVHDRSDKRGVELLIETKRDANPEVVLNQLYTHTPLESSFGIINLVLVKNVPKVLGLYDMVKAFIDFRKDIVTKRCNYELKIAKERAHILEGLRIALENIDSIVAFLKSSKDTNEAKEGLISQYSLSQNQASAILDMKLSRLISLERQKIEDEYNELNKKIEWLTEILSDINKILQIIKQELAEIKEKYGDVRRTQIIDAEDDFTIEELIPNDNVVVTITNKGYIKRIALDEYKSQNRGGKGVIGTNTKEEDFVRDMVVTKNHNHILFFTDKGRVFWLKTYAIPESGRYAAGRTIVNLLDIKDEKVTSWISVDTFNENDYLVMVTKNGIIKRISLNAFSRPRKGGVIAIGLKEGDVLVDVLKTTGNQEVILATRFGQAIRFNETEARELGRTGQGVIGIRLKDKEDAVVGAAVSKDPTIFTVTENGYGKRTHLDEYRLQSRGGSGVINIKTEGRNGSVIGVKSVKNGYDAILVTNKGQTIRIPVDSVSVIGRNTQGVRLMRLADDEKLVGFAIVRSEGEPAQQIKTEDNPESGNE
ncbi:MAG TPA: DNA gyrase subunit A [Candidatus Bilamarchaeaceae archaeon]|nr:DNA gyrase subunit A [Candidatus Bilamarchaeaceae archaeon]